MEFSVEQKIYTEEQLQRQIKIWRLKDDKIVFTNGCFDILHRGHFEYLNAASKLGNRVVIGLNSDQSIRNLKGELRPVIGEADRAYALASLHLVDAVILFHAETPLELIQWIKPDVLVKGGDYTPETIVGNDVVTAYGGQVKIIPFKAGYSSSQVMEKIKEISSKTSQIS